MNRAVKNITWEDENGVIQTFSTPAVNLDLPPEKRPPIEDDSVYLARLADKNPVMINGADFPEDGEYNLAWELDKPNSRINLNMTKAKDIHRDFLRRDRNEHFKETDSLYTQARSLGKDTTTIRARQQYLRDITALPSIDAATTTGELKAIGIDTWTPPVVSDLPDGVDPEVEKSNLAIEKSSNEAAVARITQRISDIDTRLAELAADNSTESVSEKAFLGAEKTSKEDEAAGLLARNLVIDQRLGEL